MKLLLKRKHLTPTSTIGELYVDGEMECYTLEDRVRPHGDKVPGKTAIPFGVYGVAITMSNRFKKHLPILIAVPNFEGVRIHPGNTDADTEGCILVGKTFGDNVIYHSRDAFTDVFTKIAKGIEEGGVSIEIV